MFTLQSTRDNESLNLASDGVVSGASSEVGNAMAWPPSGSTPRNAQVQFLLYFETFLEDRMDTAALSA